MKTIVCPHCGANATNLENCEYCGSLFVRFVDKGISFDEDECKEVDYSDTELGDILAGHLRLAKMPGIGAVCTHIKTLLEPYSIGLTETTVCFIANAEFLKGFYLPMINPRPSEDFLTNTVGNDAYDGYYELENNLDSSHAHESIRQYLISLKLASDAPFILVRIFIDYSDDVDVNIDRWATSNQVILKSQKKKRQFLRLGLSKLLNHTQVVNNDYKFDIYYMDLGEDVNGAASLIEDINDTDYGSYESFTYKSKKKSTAAYNDAKGVPHYDEIMPNTTKEEEPHPKANCESLASVDSKEGNSCVDERNSVAHPVEGEAVSSDLTKKPFSFKSLFRKILG